MVRSVRLNSQYLIYLVSYGEVCATVPLHEAPVFLHQRHHHRAHIVVVIIVNVSQGDMVLRVCVK